jgi:CRISPR/Cas system-associated exonuclease Cas4 (RecB family)
MAEKQACSLYGGEVLIDFFPESHRYKLSGERTYLISATAVTGIIDKSRFLIPWAVNLAGTHLKQYIENATVNQFTAEELLPVIEEALKQHTVKKEEAASIGDLIHAWAESFAQVQLKGEEMPDIADDLDERVINGISAFLDWYNAHHVKFACAEQVVYSRRHGFVGKIDAVAEVDGRKMLIDYKSGKYIYNEHLYQVAGYRLAYEEEHGKLDGAVILHFNKETGQLETKEIGEEDYEKDAATFLACLAVKQREKELTKYNA